MTTGGRPENLITMRERSKEEVREIASRGGKKSGETRRKKRKYKEIFETLLDEEITDRAGVKRTIKEAGAMNIIKKFVGGDLKAFELIRDTIGEKPVEVVMSADVSDTDIEEVQKMIKNAKQARSD